MRQTIKLGVMIIAVLAIVTSGFALAQSADDETDPVQNYQSGLLDRLAPLVEDGTITQEQADSITDTFSAQFEERQAQRAERRADRQAAKAELLELLDMTSDELKAAIADGATLGEVATTQGSSPEAVIDLMVGQAEERIADAVENGRLTAEEAEEKLAEITTKITDKVNNGGGFGHGHHRGGGRGFGPPPGAGDAPAADAVNA